MKSFKGLNQGSRLAGLSATLRQPQWIAAILSLGFHGALFAAAPSVTNLNMVALGGDAPLPDERRVPLIELTPEEQSRLPDFSSPAYSLLPGDNEDIFSLFPPSGDSLPLNPGEGLSSVPNIPTPRLPSNSVTIGVSPYTSPSRPSFIFPPRRGELPPVPSGTTPPQTPEPEAATPADPEDTASTPTATEPDSYDGPTAADLALQPGSGQPAQPPEPGSAPLNGGEAPANGQGNDLMARVEYSADQTTPAEAETATKSWIEALETHLQDDLPEGEAPLELQLPYDQGICLTPEPTDGLLGVIAVPGEEPDTLALSTTVLKSTGYPFLNQAAAQAAQELKSQYGAEENPLELGTLYQVMVKVDYNSDDCVSHDALLKLRTAEPEAGNGPNP
ncbi:MAG: hypothetical protein ACFCVD_19350 [Nodosilinea sp.]